MSIPPGPGVRIAAASAAASATCSVGSAHTRRRHFTIRIGLAAIGEFEREEDEHGLGWPS